MIASVLSRRSDVIDDLTRRTFIGGGVSLAAFPTACGSESNPAPSTGATNDRSGFPVIFEHKYGSTTIPAERRRIVVVGDLEQDEWCSWAPASRKHSPPPSASAPC